MLQSTCFIIRQCYAALFAFRIGPSINFPSKHTTIFIFLFFLCLRRGACQKEDKEKVDYCAATSSSLSTADYFSPLYPEPYPNNTDCHKLITAPADHVIELEFRGRFNVEGRDCHLLRSPFPLKKPIECFCQYDSLEVRDGPYNYSPLIGRFCGRIFPPKLRSTTRYMRIRFKSDDAIQLDGFYAIYRNVPFPRKQRAWNASECHIHLEGNEGLINASSIPKRFINDAQAHGVPLDCVFEINVDNSSQIMLRFTEIKLVNEKDCDMDFIDVHQGTLDVLTRIRQYCGGSAEELRVDSSRAYLRFMSDPTMLNENNFNGYFTALRPSIKVPCDMKTEFDCGDGYCIPAHLRCDKRINCPSNVTKADEADCEPTFSWKKTTLQSVIISVVVSVIIIGVLGVAIYLTCNEKQIAQPRRYFAPAPVEKAVANDGVFGYGCTVDEMFARSKEEEQGYFVQRVESPDMRNIPGSRLISNDSHHSDWSRNPRNGSYTYNTLPRPSHHNHIHNHGHNRRPSRTSVRRPSVDVQRTRSASPSTHRRTAVYRSSESSSNPREQLHPQTSQRTNVPVFLYSPHTKRKLTRVA